MQIRKSISTALKKASNWMDRESRTSRRSSITNDEEYYRVGPDVDTQDQTGDVRDFLELYKTLQWIFLGVKVISDSCAMLPRRVVHIEDSEEYFDDKKYHKLIQLINNPNNLLNPFELITKTISYHCLVGDAYWFLEKNNGDIQKIHVPRPDRIEVIPSPQDNVSYKRYKSSGDFEDWNMEDVVRFSSFNPISDYQGFGSSQAAQQASILELYQIIYGKRYFQNAVLPSLVFTVPELLDDNSYNRILADIKRLHQGVDKFFNAALLEGGVEPIDIKKVSPQDADFMDMKKMTREEILTALGCYHIVAILSGSTKTAVREAYRLFYEMTIMPLLENFSATINKELLSQYSNGDELKFEFDLRSAPGLRDNILDESQSDYRYWMTGIKTVNEIRKQRGFGKDLSWGDQPPPTAGLSRSSFMSPGERGTVDDTMAHPERYDVVSPDDVDDLTEEESRELNKRLLRAIQWK